MRPKHISLLFIFIFIVAIGLRIYAPLADLPPDISISGSIYTDEGNQCHNSRSKVLYDKWYEDDWQITRYNPILPYFKYAIFKIFGVGFLQVRSVSIFFSLLILIFSYLIFKSYFSQVLSLLGTALVGINFFIIMYGKIGTFEIPMIFWMIFSIYFIEKYRNTQKPYFLFLSGSTAFMAFVFKNISAYFVPVPFMAYIFYILFNNKKESIFSKKNIKNTLYIIAGILSFFAIWYILFYLPNKEWIMSAPGKYIGNQVIPKTLNQAIGNFFAFNWKEQFFKTPIIWLFSILYLPIFYRKLIHRRSDITDLAFTFFFLSHTVFFMFMNHRPTRYLLPVIFAMIFMTIQFFSYLLNKDNLQRKQLSNSQKIIFSFLDTIWIIIAYYFCISPLFFKYFSLSKIDTISIIFILIAFTISIIFNLLTYEFFYKIKNIFLKSKTPKVIVFSLFIISLMFNIYHLNVWDNNKTYTVLKINKDLKKTIRDSFIAGLTAPVSVLESNNRSLFLYPDFVNWNNDGSPNDTFIKYPITHALLASFNEEISKYFNSWPLKMNNAKLLENYNVKEEFLHLYSFKHPYIEKIKRIDEENFELIIKNPNSERTSVYINQIFLENTNSLDNSTETNIRVVEGKNLYAIKSGTLNKHKATVIKISLNNINIKNSKLVIFNIETSLKKKTLRYEGENFPGRTGKIKKLKNSSSNFVKYFDGKKHKKGFLIHGHYKPYEYSQGLIIAEFNLKFTDIKNVISPVCNIEIFDFNKQEKLASKTLIPKKNKIISNIFKNHKIFVYIPKTTKIEFRLKTVSPKSVNKSTKISLDYVDINYYQGKTFTF